MRAALRSIVVVMVLVLTTAACQSMTGKTAGANFDDATITASVKSKLVADKAGGR
jgi:hypothetical protein